MLADRLIDYVSLNDDMPQMRGAPHQNPFVKKKFQSNGTFSALSHFVQVRVSRRTLMAAALR
jgi:hypothetical protein